MKISVRNVKSKIGHSKKNLKTCPEEAREIQLLVAISVFTYRNFTLGEF